MSNRLPVRVNNIISIKWIMLN